MRKKCHVYQLSGNCNKQQQCRYEHSQLPQMTCTIKNCVLCCHEYHLKGKCRKIAICRKLHLGQPLGKCINDGVCYKCNKACHQYQMRGKCKKGKVCRFDHTGVVMKKCPFGSKNCHLCQFTREKRGPCHYLYATGTCKLGNRCQFSHKFKLGANQCMNYFCNVKGCQNYTPPLEERNDLVSSHISQIVSQINESDIYPDQLKAAELIQDNEILNNQQKTEAEEKLVNVRQSIKRSLGFNYIATKEIKGVYIQGEGIFYTPGGVQGSIKINEQEVELNIGGKIEKQKLDKGYQSQLANILVRKSKYYEANQNSQQSQSDTEEEQELKVFKNTNKNNQLSEQTMIYMPSPINAIVGGDFTICKDKNLYKKVKFEPIQQKKVLKYVKDNAERIKSEMAKFNNNMEQLKKEKEKFCVEICFLIDTTASMGSYITESKNSMKNIINQISEKVKGTKFEIKFGVVCYRDHCDDRQGSYLVQGKDFEKDIDIIINYINTVDSRGGGDTPEAVVDGINQALQLSWSKNENSWGGSQRIIFHIADAPPHGDIYKEEGSYRGDDHPNGCPCGLKFNKLSTQINNNDISYHLVAIGSCLKKTIKVFENSLQSFNYCNIQGASQMTENIIEMLTKYPWWNVKA
ncbi:hypothetical protein PPERSA_04677 [Pseudocohnilembus persalinus]|uniref:Uncharacterized protein n=1 Tax=Pseudocohnilembus persalinus TaxID=266149 RepID=A0A0V0R4F9_PSEPJ|nr:hypothetical protein PPERSA_04677 [Pseudocohnilembus persalinus]|eukprot:KRX09371.1 hypothetical protein PPERSA_04677 [Pseudocohnilembus persalinus]